MPKSSDDLSFILASRSWSDSSKKDPVTRLLDVSASCNPSFEVGQIAPAAVLKSNAQVSHEASPPAKLQALVLLLREDQRHHFCITCTARRIDPIHAWARASFGQHQRSPRGQRGSRRSDDSAGGSRRRKDP